MPMKPGQDSNPKASAGIKEVSPTDRTLPTAGPELQNIKAPITVRLKTLFWEASARWHATLDLEEKPRIRATSELMAEIIEHIRLQAETIKDCEALIKQLEEK